jgi:hypothetical protein
MIFLQRITHFLGLSIGLVPKVFKWRLRKRRSKVTSLGELNKMLPKILSQDSNYDEWCEEEIMNAYRQAAECDEYLFGDYDYEKEWKLKKSKSDEEGS